MDRDVLEGGNLPSFGGGRQEFGGTVPRQGRGPTAFVDATKCAVEIEHITGATMTAWRTPWRGCIA